MNGIPVWPLRNK